MQSTLSEKLIDTIVDSYEYDIKKTYAFWGIAIWSEGRVLDEEIIIRRDYETPETSWLCNKIMTDELHLLDNYSLIENYNATSDKLPYFLQWVGNTTQRTFQLAGGNLGDDLALTIVFDTIKHATEFLDTYYKEYQTIFNTNCI